MEDWIEIKKDPKHVNRERQKAKEMRKTAWWKNELAKGICHYCKAKFPVEELSMDHVVPVVRGGKTKKGNVVVCCKTCNSEKKYLTPVEMILKEMAEKGEI